MPKSIDTKLIVLENDFRQLVTRLDFEFAGEEAARKIRPRYGFYDEGTPGGNAEEGRIMLSHLVDEYVAGGGTVSGRIALLVQLDVFLPGELSELYRRKFKNNRPFTKYITEDLIKEFTAPDENLLRLMNAAYAALFPRFKDLPHLSGVDQWRSYRNGMTTGLKWAIKNSKAHRGRIIRLRDTTQG